MLIGLSGKKGSGKSTLAAHCATIVMSFARPLKEWCAERFGLSRDILYGDDAAKNQRSPYAGWTYRQILQFIGSAVRKVDPLHWIKLTLADALAYSRAGRLVAIDDVRYRNEADAIRDAGGVVVRLTRVVDASDAHPSETELDDYPRFDLVVRNHEMSVEQSAAVLQAFIAARCGVSL